MGIFTMPSLGADMEAGILVEWLKQPGDLVKRGDVVAVVETDKGAIEVEIFEDGVIEQLLVPERTKVPVGTPLAAIAGIAQKVGAQPGPGPELPHAPVPPAPSVAPPAPSLAPAPVPPAAPARRASPAARKLAAERGISLEQIEGSGPDGGIVARDVESRLAPARARPGLDLGQMRRAIAAAMAKSKREIPHYYLSHSFDFHAARTWVENYNAARPPEERILPGVLPIKATAMALRDFPEFNGFHDEGGHRPTDAIHVGIAISIRGGGLAAPAIHDVDRLGLGELMAKLRDLTARARRGQLRSSELSDATVTVSSLGDRGVEALLPIIYPPQVAIVGVGAVLNRPWAVGDAVGVRPVMTVSLGADHRVSDGHRGALLLRQIETLLQQPEVL
jgi:pyruvate dehydrogenase E2 component (dihydrolipoamide acetyltransferase)